MRITRGYVWINICLLWMLLGYSCSKNNVEVYGSISGVVTLSPGGEPFAGVKVFLNRGGKLEVTGEDGHYEFRDLEPYDYTLQFIAEGCRSENHTLTVEPGKRTAGDMIMRSGSSSLLIINNYLDFGTGDNVRVFDVKNTGKIPLFFEIKEEEPWLSVSPVKDSVLPGRSIPVTVTIDRKKLSGNITHTLSVASDGGSADVIIKVAVSETGDLRGIITDMETNEPLRGVNVSLQPLGIAMTTGSDGRYEFYHIEVGQYTVQATKDKYQTDTKTVTIRVGQAVQLDMLLRMGQGNMQVSRNYLDFGTNSKILVFDIKNTGKTNLDFNIQEDESWLSVSPASGTVAPNTIFPVTVTVDRSLITENKNYTLAVASGGGSEEITVKVLASSGGGGGDPGDDGDASVIASGLIALYTFDSESGDDATLNGYHGSVQNQPSYPTDTPNGTGNSLLLVATKKQYINIPYNPLYDKYHYSISFWLKDFSDGMIMGAINTSDSPKFSRSSFPRIICRDGKFVLYCNYDNYDETPAFNYEVTPLKSDGKWHMITMTCTKADTYDTPFERKLYVDGVLVASSNLVGWKFGYSQGKPTEFHIGGNGGKTDMSATTLRIDNVRMYDRALDRDEVDILYRAER